MIEKRFTIKKSGKGLFYSDGDYSIDNTIQFVIETVESKLNQLNDENNELKSRLCDCHTFLSSKTMVENSNAELRKENEQLTKLLILIADAESTRSENSVKEILRNTLFGLDTVAGESYNAFKEYCILNKFFKEHYKEYWDNDKYD